MGQEINKKKFTQEDFVLFSKAVKNETEILAEWLKQGKFDNQQLIAGLELEAWLIDAQQRPAAVNEDFFRVIESDYFSPELARFNIELNVDPLPLTQDVFAGLEQSVRLHWHQSRMAAQKLNADVLAIGILPTLKETDLTIGNMSKMARYEALNEQVMQMRKGRPLSLHVIGKSNLQTDHYDVMLEAAATSLQLHIQVPEEKAVAYYNSSVLISALTVAASANSPFLFGKNLWEESRIPLFEQAVASGGFDAAADGPLHRVSFGSGYCRNTLLECFEENLQHFPPLLPMMFENADQLEHLRLHNGTIWRWNRPIIGFNENAEPHLRIEHRVMAAGPTVLDEIANTALYYGLAHYYAEHETPVNKLLEFAVARDNFYQAARYGLSAHVNWIDGKRYLLKTLLLDQLLGQMQTGLKSLKIIDSDIEFFTQILQARISSGHTGSDWQQRFVERHGNNMALLTEQYGINQNSGKPVHEWTTDLIHSS